MDDSFKISFGIFNLDSSNRHEKISEHKALSDAVTNILVDDMNIPDIISCTESSNKAWVQHFESQEGGQWHGFSIPGTYTNNYTAWHKGRWELVSHPIRSAVGHYSAVILEHKETKQRVFHVTTHFPSKNPRMWEKNAQLIKGCLDEYREKSDFDLFSVAGDFNAKPSKVQSHFPTMMQAIVDDSIFTTRRGNSVDNMLTSIGEFNLVKLYQEVEYLSHHPLQVDCVLSIN
jgi:hypothetical protein